MIKKIEAIISARKDARKTKEMRMPQSAYIEKNDSDKNISQKENTGRGLIIDEYV